MRLFCKSITKKIIPLAIIIAFFLVLIASARFDSTTIDESPHITAAYSYVTNFEYRLNTEHPPLLKDLAGVFLLPLNLTFPTYSHFWLDDPEGYGNVMPDFMFRSGNDIDQILFFARLGPILLATLLAFIIFWIAKSYFGRREAYLSLLLFTLSPTILAHARYVTTDVAAAFGFVISICFFLKFLKVQTTKNLVLAGVFFGVAQLTKFSTILLIPFLLFTAIAYFVISNPKSDIRAFLKNGFKLAGKTIVVFAIGYLFIVWPVYKIHTLGYAASPASAAERQLVLESDNCGDIEEGIQTANQFSDLACLHKSLLHTEIGNVVVAWSENELLRPFALYASGVLQVVDRVSEDDPLLRAHNYLGSITTESHKSYYFVLYLLKEPIALHVLAVIALFALILAVKRRKLLSLVREHFEIVTMLAFIVFYLTVSMTNDINIGVRHIIPIYPFIFLLVGKGVVSWYDRLRSNAKLFSIVALMIWYAVSSLGAYPNFLPYYNEFAGGSTRGYVIATDSNADWGQGLKQLGDFVRENNISPIYIDFFSPGGFDSYLDDWIIYTSAEGPPKGWFAISTTPYMLATGAGGWDGYMLKENSYSWLHGVEPVAFVANSVLIYYFPN